MQTSSQAELERVALCWLRSRFHKSFLRWQDNLESQHREAADGYGGDRPACIPLFCESLNHQKFAIGLDVRGKPQSLECPKQEQGATCQEILFFAIKALQHEVKSVATVVEVDELKQEAT